MADSDGIESGGDELEEFRDATWSYGTPFALTRKPVAAVAEEDSSGSMGGEATPLCLVAKLPGMFSGVVHCPILLDPQRLLGEPS